MRSAVHRKEKIEGGERRGRGEGSLPKEEGGQEGLEKLLPGGQEEQQKAAETGERGGGEVREVREGDGARTRETETQFHLCQVFVADNGENTMHRREFQKLRRMRGAF